MTGCVHLTLEVNAEVNEPEGQRWRFLALRVRCEVCGEAFSFRGLASGTPNESEPCTSADGYELRAPITPGPGGIVGVLRYAGLEHLLAAPDAQEEES